MPWFPYLDLGSGPRPYLVVWIDPAQPLAGLIDSGADGSSLPLGIAQLLGVRFDTSKTRTAGGAGGDYQEYQAEHDVVLQCACGPVTLVRPAVNPKLPIILLGRADVFSQFRFSFDQRRLLFLIEPQT